jgi:single-strand DNA-binding protein
MNQVSFTCRLTKDPEVRHVATANSHASVVTLRVAIDDRQRSKERPGLFLDIEAWGPLATTCGEHLSKGSLVGVSGRLDRDEWQAKDGSPRDRVFVAEATKEVFGYRSVGVFDIAQTDPIPGADPMPLQPPSVPIQGDSHQHVLPRLTEHATSLGFTVIYEATQDCHGYCDHANHVIALNASRRTRKCEFSSTSFDADREPRFRHPAVGLPWVVGRGGHNLVSSAGADGRPCL